MRDFFARLLDTRPPRGAVAVVAVGLVACVVAAVATTGKGEGEAAQLEWVQHESMPDSPLTQIAGGRGRMQLVDAGLRATGTNVSGYSLYRSTATLAIKAGSPIGSGRVRCSNKAPAGTEVAQTPGSRASYPRSSEKLNDQAIPEVVLVEFSSHGDSLAVVDFEDLFEKGFATEPGVKVGWPTYRLGEERWDWFLPPGPPKETLELPFASVWKTTAVPSASIACTLVTSAGTTTVRTHGTMSKRPEPIAEE